MRRVGASRHSGFVGPGGADSTIIVDTSIELPSVMMISIVLIMIMFLYCDDCHVDGLDHESQHHNHNHGYTSHHGYHIMNAAVAV